MSKRSLLVLGIVALILISFSLGTAQKSVVSPKKEVVRVPADQIKPIKPPPASGSKDSCYLAYTLWDAGAYYAHWKLGDKVAIYFDPEDCGWLENYPFQLTDVHFLLYNPGGVDTVDLRFSVEVVCPDICDGPGIEIWRSQVYHITTFGDYVQIYFPDTVCLDKPFFFNVEYMSDYPDGMMPSLIFDFYTEPMDTCYQWVWTGQPSWVEWHDFWYPQEGVRWVNLGISGFCGEEQAECGWWYWKPDTLPQAPSGMPDFDQNQDEWSCYCGPTAVANCLWWFDAVPTAGMDPADFIELLAGYFSTGPGGTHVDSIQAGLERYFEDYGFALTETTYWMPDFHEMEDSLKVCQDIILLLGFWWYEEDPQQFIRGDVDENGIVDGNDFTACQSGPPFSCDDAADVNDDGVLDYHDCDYLYAYLMGAGPPPPPPFPSCGVDPTADALDCADFPPCPGGGPGEWFREGGHFVTMAGVNSEKKEIAISDPDRDQCVLYPWWPGRVRTADHPPWGGYGPEFHNDPQFVSHDVYVSLLYPEFPSPGSEVWDLADYCFGGYKYTNMNVPERFRVFTKEAPKHYEYWHTEVEAAVMICPIPNRPPEINQPDFLEGFVDDEVRYEITALDPDGDVILDEASIDIQPGCGDYMITRVWGHGTSSGTWRIYWDTHGCTPCDTHMVIHDLTDERGAVAYCTTWVHLSEKMDTCWYWKPDTLPQAPSGMPDFDQNQDAWFCYCGPTAVANCLWWYGAVPPGWTPPQLIDTLARYFHTSPVWGTYVDTMQMGLEQYFQDYGFVFTESTFVMPNFYEMEDSLKVCQDIILLLGFWFFDEGSGTWYREGGHYVTMAGVCSESLKIAISDPDKDAAVGGWPGRVRPPWHPNIGAYPPELHNDPTYVSHDMYNSILDNPFPSPGNPFWEIDYSWMKGDFSGINVPEEFRAITRPAPEGGKQIFATEVEYAVMICPTGEEPRECDENDPRECDTLWVECGNMLVPPGGGLVTVDMTIAFDESLMAIQVPLSYEGSPLCCDSMPDSENTVAKVFAGSILPGTWIKVISIDHQAKTIQLGAVALMPPTDCLPPGKGHFATLTLFGDSCCTILLDTTTVQGNSVGFMECNDPDMILFYPVCRIDTCHIDRNNPPEIGQPDTLYGYQVCDTVIYQFSGTDPDGDVILDGASLAIEPSCGTYSVTRLTGHGTSTGTWEVTWETAGCEDSIYYKIIVDLTDVWGNTAYCTTYCHLAKNNPPEITQPDSVDGYINDVVNYTITGADPDSDVILNQASIDIVPSCGVYSITRISGHGTASGTWQISWATNGCLAATYLVIHDMTDGCDTSYCTTYVRLDEKPGWHWKDPYEDYAPNGMPDIDQRQDNWVKMETGQFSFCGPCAVANCFKWFDSKYNVPPGFPCDGIDMFPLVRDYMDNLPPWNAAGIWDDHDPWNVDHIGTPWSPSVIPPPPTAQPFIPGPQPQPSGMDPWGELVERLAWYFDTDGIQTGYCNHTGTNIVQMQDGIQMWFDSETFPDGSTLADTLCEVTTPMPTFAYVESLVEKCEDVILLLGFWYENPPGSGQWFRVGGHYVTVAGVNSTDIMIAFCDPFVDAAELGLLGRVGDGLLIPHTHGAHDPTVHNDEGNVSQDIYFVSTEPVSPGGLWWIPEYAVYMNINLWMANFSAQNVPEEFLPVTAPWDGMSPIYTEVEYCVHISPWDYRGDINVPGGDGVVDIGDVVFLLNFLYRGGPSPDPYLEGDINCDGVIDLGDVVRLINYLFKGWPVPRCCDP